jgi:hypothetical protein
MENFVFFSSACVPMESHELTDKIDVEVQQFEREDEEENE